MDHEDHRFPFEKAARLDDPKRLEQQPLAPVIELLQLSPGSRVLDLGAGTGYFALPLAAELESQGGSGGVWALDIEPRMLELLARKAEARGLSQRITLMEVGDPSADPWPLPEAAVDRALLVNLYHELPRPVATLRELRRVLAPGGLLVVVDWHPDGRSDKGPPPDHRVHPDQVASQATEAGFLEVTNPPLYPNYYAVVARR